MRALCLSLGLVVGLTACSAPELEAEAGGDGSALRVYARGSSLAIQGAVDPGEPVVFGLPYVCVVDDPVALVGVELRDPDPGLHVTDVLVTRGNDGGPLVRKGQVLARSRIAKQEASPGGVVSIRCKEVGVRDMPGEAGSQRVFAELVLEGPRSLATADAIRYVYEEPPGGEVRRTDWVETGFGLDTRSERRPRR